MKHAAYILGFALLALMLGMVLTRVFAWWYAPRYIHGDVDEASMIKVLLVFWPSCLIVGGSLAIGFPEKPNTSLHRTRKSGAPVSLGNKAQPRGTG